MNNSVFLKAIDILNNYGWTKGKYYREKEGYHRGASVGIGYCLIGACARAAEENPIEWENSIQYSILSRFTGMWTPIYYNDYVIYSKEKAIEVLRKAYEHECELAKATADFSVPPV